MAIPNYLRVDKGSPLIAIKRDGELETVFYCKPHGAISKEYPYALFYDHRKHEEYHIANYEMASERGDNPFVIEGYDDEDMFYWPVSVFGVVLFNFVMQRYNSPEYYAFIGESDGDHIWIQTCNGPLWLDFDVVAPRSIKEAEEQDSSTLNITLTIGVMIKDMDDDYKAIKREVWNVTSTNDILDVIRVLRMYLNDMAIGEWSLETLNHD